MISREEAVQAIKDRIAYHKARVTYLELALRGLETPPPKMLDTSEK